jgi:hypothetical protein
MALTFALSGKKKSAPTVDGSVCAFDVSMIFRAYHDCLNRTQPLTFFLVYFITQVATNQSFPLTVSPLSTRCAGTSLASTTSSAMQMATALPTKELIHDRSLIFQYFMHASVPHQAPNKIHSVLTGTHACMVDAGRGTYPIFPASERRASRRNMPSTKTSTHTVIQARKSQARQ